MKTELFPANEIVGAMASSMISDIETFAKDPKGVIASQLGIQTEASFSVVENSSEEVHLALPYYESFEAGRAQMLADGSIADVSGGEILIMAGVLGGLTIGAAAGLGFAGASIAAAVGGTVGTIAVAGITVGAVAGVKKANRIVEVDEEVGGQAMMIVGREGKYYGK